jgi:PleD family two-component response regulator
MNGNNALLPPEVLRPILTASTKLDSSRILIVDDQRTIHDDIRKILANPAESSLEETEAALFDREPESNEQTSFALDSAYQGSEGLALVQAPSRKIVATPWRL